LNLEKNNNIKQKNIMAPFIVSVEGNIGSGKSTLIDCLKSNKNLKINNREVIFLPEPVKEWEEIQDKQGQNMIEKFYKDQYKYAFSFQFMAYISRLAILQKAIKKHPDAIIITERCLYTDKNVFCSLLFENDKIEDVNYAIYNKWFEHFLDKAQVDLYIYLRTDPVISDARIKIRKRSGENIPLDYLIKCNDKHQTWLNNEMDVLIIDGNKENGNHEMDNEWCNKINEKIQDYVIRQDHGTLPKYQLTDNCLRYLVAIFYLMLLNFIIKGLIS
jgi:deoxyadenosine/deoxycytidine kinase